MTDTDDDTLSRSAYKLNTNTHIILESVPSNFATGCSTGWMTWNASVVLCDYLEQHQSTLIHNQHVADLSSGNGLVAVCLASLSSTSVVATETKDCTALTQQNVNLNKVDDKTTVHEYYWGKSHPNPCLACSLVTFCDLLYIAIRDSLEEELEQTIRELCTNNTCTLYFAFEQRLGEEEDSFMARLQEPSVAGGGGLSVVQIANEHLNLARLGPVDDTSLEALLYIPPIIKLYTIASSENTPTPASLSSSSTD